VRLGPELREVLESGDLAHDALVQAIRAFDSFEVRDSGSLVCWLSRIVENTVRMAWRRHARRRSYFRSGLRSEPFELEHAEDTADPVANACDRELGDRIETAIRALPEERREALLLRNYAGASWETVGRLLGRRSPGAARMLHTRALLDLRRMLDAPDEPL
jgi:RNA polymerase sigma-70 factor, ECF subfamily